MLSFAVGFIVSLLVTLLIVRYAHLHERFSIDNDLAGVQKFHARPVPRVGGTGILIGLVVATALLSRRYPAIAGGILGLAACGLPAFASGLIEDLTKKVTPAVRLVCTMAAAALAFALMGIAITRISVPPLTSCSAIRRSRPRSRCSPSPRSRTRSTSSTASTASRRWSRS